jgi:TrmH family RNA methyltransferase
MPTVIASLQNSRVKDVVRLRERRHREREGLMLVEGREELELALAGGARPQALYYCPSRQGAGAQALLQAAAQAGAELVEVTGPVFDKLAYRENPDGWLAVVLIDRRPLASLALGARPLLLVAEAVEKPGNLGALLRSADAAGASAVVVCDPATDVHNPNVVRSSRGTLFTVPVVEAPTREVLPWLAEHAIAVVAATPQAHLTYTQADLRGPVAVAVGTEHEGLSATWLQSAAIQVRIPMLGRVNSLNVATAATLLLYEAVRQRASG